MNDKGCRGVLLPKVPRVSDDGVLIPKQDIDAIATPTAQESQQRRGHK